MHKETITYTDYDGNERTEDFYFNLTEAEIAKMEMSTPGGLTKMMQRIVQAMDGEQIIETFESLIAKAYGVKSSDGRKFVKNKDVLDDFRQTEAYSKLFIKLCTDSKFASRFFENILPKQAAEEASSIPRGRELANNELPIL